HSQPSNLKNNNSRRRPYQHYTSMRRLGEGLSRAYSNSTQPQFRKNVIWPKEIHQSIVFE
ncbi:MAG TPA: hypothetical protein VGC31_07100, partial [Paenirhodobacter sp.]